MNDKSNKVQILSYQFNISLIYSIDRHFNELLLPTFRIKLTEIK